jgi:hypothetical protein
MGHMKYTDKERIILYDMLFLRLTTSPDFVP